MTRAALLHRVSQLAAQLVAIAAALDADASDRLVLVSAEREIARLAEEAQQRVIARALAAQQTRRRQQDLRPAYDVRTHIDTKFGRHARGTCRCAA